MALPAGTARHEVAALSFARLFLPELLARSLLPASGLCWPDLCTPRIHFVHHAFVLDITCLFCTSAKLFLPGVNTACLQPPGYREPLKPCCIQGAADLVRKMKNRGPESINSFLHDHMYFFFGKYKRSNSISKPVSSSVDSPALSGAVDAQYLEEFNPEDLDLEEKYVDIVPR